MPELSVRLRTPSGVKTLSLPEDATLPTLRDAAASAAALTPASLVLRAGFPPKPLDLSADGPAAAVLAPGEVVTAAGTPQQKPEPEPPALAATTAPASSAAPVVARNTSDSIAAAGRMRERQVPDDNSCLFRAVSGLVFGEPGRDPNVLRRVCADAVAADPVFYNTALLGKPNAAYCKSILDPVCWGGQVELAILSDHFKMEFGAWDLKSMHASNYGEGRYDTVGYLVYDGAHYNYVALELASGIPDVTQFPATDNVAREKARATARARHDRGDFTDTDNNKLRCASCSTVVDGARGAEAHGRATGHGNFVELR